MYHYLILAWPLVSLAILAGGGLGWQLLRQNGRLLLRLDELEKRLDALEFGGEDQPTGLPVGSDAPAFELPDPVGTSRALAQFRGQPLLLIFFNPACGFCKELLAKLFRVAAGFQPAVKGGILPPGRIVVVSTGQADANRRLFDEHKLPFPVLLQKGSEVAEAYLANGTPSGYLISREGKIASDLAVGADALLELLQGKPESGEQKAQMAPLSAAASSNGANGDKGEKGRAERFTRRSLAGSKIKRDGLKAGTPAPEFRLPRLDGRGDLSLSQLRGRRVLLVFSSPGCGPCNALAPQLEKFHRAQTERDRSPVAAASNARDAGDLAQPREGVAAAVGDRPRSGQIRVVMISKGEPKENRAKVKEHGLTFPIVLQQQWEISRRYAMFATPIAYLIDEQGVISRDVAVGVEPILALASESARINEAAPVLRA